MPGSAPTPKRVKIILCNFDVNNVEFDDEEWKDEVSARVAQVRAWDLKAALKCSPIYAKYFRMQNYGKYISVAAFDKVCVL